MQKICMAWSVRPFRSVLSLAKVSHRNIKLAKPQLVTVPDTQSLFKCPLGMSLVCKMNALFMLVILCIIPFGYRGVGVKKNVKMTVLSLSLSHAHTCMHAHTQ